MFSDEASIKISSEPPSRRLQCKQKVEVGFDSGSILFHMIGICAPM
jgi:hypothetical protein